MFTKRTINIVGKRFGKLVVVSFYGRDKHGQLLWECICDCGNACTKQGNRLRSGKTQSCGCKTTATHGMSKHLLWGVWNSMIQRCYNPNTRSYKSYGGKGVVVCKQWKEDSTAFIQWAKPKWKRGLTIDRIDSKKGYFPENCRFISLKENVLRKDVTGCNTGKIFGTWKIIERCEDPLKVYVECIRCKKIDKFHLSNVTRLKCRQCDCVFD